MDFSKILGLVKDSGFSGFIGVEFEGQVEDPLPGMLATKTLIEKTLAL
jgi:hypothetical protein